VTKDMESYLNEVINLSKKEKLVFYPSKTQIYKKSQPHYQPFSFRKTKCGNIGRLYLYRNTPFYY